MTGDDLRGRVDGPTQVDDVLIPVADVPVQFRRRAFERRQRHRVAVGADPLARGVHRGARVQRRGQQREEEQESRRARPGQSTRILKIFGEFELM